MNSLQKPEVRSFLAHIELACRLKQTFKSLCTKTGLRMEKNGKNNLKTILKTDKNCEILKNYYNYEQNIWIVVLHTTKLQSRWAQKSRQYLTHCTGNGFCKHALSICKLMVYGKVYRATNDRFLVRRVNV